MKRPMIFISGLNQQQIEHLKSLSDYKYVNIFSRVSINTQVYTYSDGTLEIADNPVSDKYQEVICTSYEEFLTKWEQYRLWVMLQTE